MKDLLDEDGTLSGHPSEHRMTAAEHTPKYEKPTCKLFESKFARFSETSKL